MSAEYAPSDLVTQTEAAARLKKSERTIRRWNLPIARRDGREVLYRWGDVLNAARTHAEWDNNWTQHKQDAEPVLRRLQELKSHAEVDAMPLNGDLVRMFVWNAITGVLQQQGNSLALCAGKGRGDWQKKYKLTGAQFAALVFEAFTFIVAGADHWLSTDFDDEFKRQCGVSVHEMSSLLMHASVRSRPFERNQLSEAINAEPTPELIQQLLTPSVMGELRRKGRR